jgi:DNA invertase Pin-like site-specific DNA recombinase
MAAQTIAPLAFQLQETAQAVPDGRSVGYVRVSTGDQNTVRQLDGVKLDKVFTDNCTGSTIKRTALENLLKYVRAGDVLHVHSIDRLARNLIHLQQLVKQLHGKGVAIVFHKERMILDSRSGNNPLCNFVVQMLGAFAEFELACIKERQREGIAKAKAEGRMLGRQSKLTAEDIAEMQAMKNAGTSMTEIGKHFNMTRQGIYKALKRDAGGTA